MKQTTREKVYAFIRRRLLAGPPPSVGEVRREIDLQTLDSARGHIDALVEEGRLEKPSASYRWLRLPASVDDRPEVMVPVMRPQRCGLPELELEEPFKFIPFRSRLSQKRLFGWKMIWEGMTDVDIMPGDYLVIRRQQEAKPGQIVAAYLGKEQLTIKTLKWRNKRWELHSENRDYPTLIPTPLRPLTIVGLVLDVRQTLPKNG